MATVKIVLNLKEEKYIIVLSKEEADLLYDYLAFTSLAPSASTLGFFCIAHYDEQMVEESNLLTAKHNVLITGIFDKLKRIGIKGSEE